MSGSDYALMFAATYFSVFLLGLQSRNVNAGRYVAAVVTSLGISVANFMFVKFASTGDALAFVLSASGGCLGIASSIWFYENVVKREKKNIPVFGAYNKENDHEAYLPVVPKKATHEL